jgi:PAS domain S-box-containing protein
MHYIGMDAMRLPAMCRYDPFLVILSVVFALLISLAALWITFHLRVEKARIGRRKIAGAVVMGAAIPIMHYTGMAAASFTPSGIPVNLSNAVSISTLGTAGIAAATLIVLGLALLTSWVDRRFAAHTLGLQEAKLQQSEAYLSEAQRISHTGSLGWRPSTGEILWSDETFRIFQYDRTTKPTVELVLQRVHPDDAAFVKQTIDRASQDGKDFDFEHRLLMPDGLVKHVHVVAHALTDESGDTEFVGAVMDVTEQRQAKAALERAFDEIKKSEDRLRMVIDTIPGMVWSGLTDGTFDFVNQPWLRYLGCSWEELSARGGLLSVVHQDDVEESVDRWKVTRATGRHTDHELRMRGADGKYRWFLARVLPLRDELGNILKFYGTVTDIEDRKRAEMLLAGEKRLLEMIARGDSPALILDALCRFVEELASGSLSSILLLDPNGNRLRHGAAPSLPQSYTEAIDGSVIGPSVGSCGTAAYRKEPVIVSDIATDVLWVDYRDLALAHGLRACWSTPILSSDDRVLGTFAIYFREPLSPTPQHHNIIEQVTHLASIAIERKQAEEALHKAQAELAHVTRVMTMGELVASIAHEVNQPLGAIVTNGHACVRLLSREVPDLEKSREVIERMIRDGMRASEVIKRIRDLLHKSPPEKAPLNINETIQEVIALVSSDVLRSKVELKAELAADLPPVAGDRIQLQQVILNLILNAKDAMSAVKTHPRELQITSRKNNAGVVVAVRDTGHGLEAKDVDRIFDPFFTTKPEGTGLGLSISRTIIEAHGGTLWATQNEDKGATIQFTLQPVQRE